MKRNLRKFLAFSISLCLVLATAITPVNADELQSSDSGNVALNFKVTYDGNGATSGKVPIDEKTYLNGDTVTVLGNKGLLNKTGYKFNGWNTEADGLGTNYAANDTFTIGESDITLYAKWQDISEELNWQTVGDAVSEGESCFTSIALDNDGTPYVAYQDKVNSNKISVKKYVGNIWIPVGNLGFSTGIAEKTSITVDSVGIPYVAYSDGADDDKITVMKFVDGNWVTVGNTGFSTGKVYTTSIKVDNNGTIYVVFTDQVDAKYLYENNVTVMKFDGISWIKVSEQKLPELDYPYTGIKVALDNNGTIYIAVSDPYCEAKATVMKFDGNSWVTVGNSGFSAGPAYHLSLVVDRYGTLFVVYQDYFNSAKATVMKYDVNSWVTVGNRGFSAGEANYTSIVIDNSGIPFVSYCDWVALGKATVMKYDDGVSVSVDSVKTGDTNYDGNWTKNDVTITLNGDATTGIKKFQYSTDNGLTWYDVDGTELTVNQTSNNDYIFRAESNGNLSSVPSEPVTIKVDKTNPSIENITGNPTELINTNQEISFTINDIDSGINPQSVTVKKGDKVIPTTLESGKYSFLTDGNGQYIISVSDFACNTVTQTVEVTKIDLEKPAITTLSPSDKEENADVTSLTITFNEPIKKSDNHGDIAINKKDGTVFEKVDIQNNRIKIKDNKLTLCLSKPLVKSTSYYVTIANDIISDLAGNLYNTTEATPWSFTTANILNVNALLGIDISNMGEQYSAVAEDLDTSELGIEGAYSAIASPNEDGTADVTILPKFAIKGTKFTISTQEEGVTITDNKVKIDAETNHVLLQVTYTENNDIGDVKISTLLIYKGNIDENIVNEGMGNIYVKNLKGTISNVAGQTQLEFNITKNTLTDEQMSQIKDIKGNQSIALSFNSGLVYNWQNGVKSDVSYTQDIETVNGKPNPSGGSSGGGVSVIGNAKYTQNPITIGIKMPSEMLAGSNYKVILLDNGIAEIIDCQAVNNYLEFNTDELGQFILLYTPKPKSSGSNGGGSSSKNNSSNDVTITTNSVHVAYMEGYKDNTFMPDNNITRAEIATIIAKLSDDYKDNQSYTASFNDVKEGSWYSNVIGFCKTKGYINGYEDGTFNPEGNMTRAEFAAAIARFKNLNIEKTLVAPFNDISGNWAEDYIMALYNESWISGYEDGTFKPDEFITRAEAVKLINAVLGRTPSKEDINAILANQKNPFKDVLATHWAYYDILEATINHANMK